MNPKVFIQLGLENKLNYSYLADDNYRTLSPEGSKFYLPEPLREKGPFTVIGVDMIKAANDQIRERHQQNPRIYIWDHVIWHEDIPDFKHGTYVADPEYIAPVSYKHFGDQDLISEAITLKTLIKKIRDIPGHADCEISGLHLNIEGSEANVLQSLDLSDISPLSIRVATWHAYIVKSELTVRNTKAWMSVLTASGYKYVPDPRDAHEYLTFFRDDR